MKIKFLIHFLILNLLWINFELKSQNIDIHKITDSKDHQAFTSITYFKGVFYLTFREAHSHLSPNGKIVLLKSLDGINYFKDRDIRLGNNIDYRDPKLINIKDSVLILSYFSVEKNKNSTTKENIFRKSIDGLNWSDPIKMDVENYWLWSPRYINGNLYSIGYKQNSIKDLPNLLALFKINLEDQKFEIVKEFKFSNGYASEADIIEIEGEKVLIVLRRDYSNGLYSIFDLNHLQMDITWTNFNYPVESPHLFKFNNRIFLTGRIGSDKKTSILQYKKSKFEFVTDLPQIMGDNGYPSIASKDEFIYMSYYNSPNNQTDIYLAKIYYNNLFSTNLNFSVKSELDNNYSYPNPFIDYINVNLKDFRSKHRSVKIEVLTLNGKVLLNDFVNLSNYFGLYYTINIKNLDQGAYILKLSNEKFISSQQIIKK